MRELAVTDAIPQKPWATMITRRRNSAPWLPNALWKITPGATGLAEAAAYMPVLDMAQVTPTMSTKPATSDTQIELTIPLGPDIEGSRVSSVMWAEAS
jgi:hypothetical protein